MSVHAPLAPPTASASPAHTSLRLRLMLGLLAPLLLFIFLNSLSMYRQALQAANTAYDRTLLASAKSIGEQLDVAGYDDQASVEATVPYAALEAFETHAKSRLYYRVSALDSTLITGFKELPFWRGTLPDHSPYAALVDFYNDQFELTPVRVAVLLQPVTSAQGRSMAVIQVAETLELRQELAQQVLLSMVWRQLLLLAGVAGAVVMVVHWATRPLRTLGAHLAQRKPDDLSPVPAQELPRELQPVANALTDLMTRLRRQLALQKRFVRTSAQQLRTPLAVLQTQLRSARKGDVPADQILDDISNTVERANAMTHQMLALAKIEQMREQPGQGPQDLAQAAKQAALDLAPHIQSKALQFNLNTQPAWVQAHAWMLQELVRNLLHNAIKHSPNGSTLCLQVLVRDDQAQLQIHDAGPGVPAALRDRLFEPFSATDTSMRGSGLGLAICREIVLSLGGSITVENRQPTDSCPAEAHEAAGEGVQGVSVTVLLPVTT